VNLPTIVTRHEWLAARKELPAREKELDHERDRLTEARRKLPMVEVEKEYVFDGPQGVVIGVRWASASDALSLDCILCAIHSNYRHLCSLQG
jgi:predicted dithiol-disulfide oxidoreductase (DUF899 family)